MKIAIVCSYYPWPPSVGGVETIVRNVSTELAKRGREVYVVTTPFDVTTMKQVSTYGVEERDGVIVYKLKPGRLRVGYARFLKELKETLKEIRPEIVHEHNLHPHLFQLAKWKDDNGYRLVAELHHPAVEIDFLIQRLVMPFAELGLRHVSKAIDVFVVHTMLEKEWLVSRGIPNGKTALVRFPAVPSKLLNYNVHPTDLSDILYLGRIVHRKGVHILIRALSMVKQRFSTIRASVAGPSDLPYLESLKTLVEKLGLRDNVSFIGTIREEEKHVLIKSHKIVVLPSLKDYTPNVLLEAQALGVPVIATKVGAVPEIMVDRETGFLVEPNNDHALAKAIEMLVSDQELRRRLSIRAKEFAKNFTLEKQVDKLESLYSETSACK
uniref:Glycosyltransferase family 1 protein n=1 Tax=Fervidicoccus fontis TaxID=683846 RepID=A0A7J3SJS0_9CREN